LPIDVCSIAKDIGVKIATEPLPDEVSGILSKKNTKGVEKAHTFHEHAGTSGKLSPVR
jgi:hypothetical protein